MPFLFADGPRIRGRWYTALQNTVTLTCNTSYGAGPAKQEIATLASTSYNYLVVTAAKEDHTWVFQRSGPFAEGGWI
jgi:hypothetical protein